MVIAIALIVGIIGILGVRIGLRGRQIDHNPVCSACKYDLSGAPHNKCSECGLVASTDSLATIGNRQRITSLVVVGIHLITVSAGVLVSDTMLNAFDRTWLAVRSTDAVWNEALDGSFDGVRELSYRLENDKLPIQLVRSIADDALRLRHEPGGSMWVPFLDTASIKGQLLPKQRNQLYQDSVVAHWWIVKSDSETHSLNLAFYPAVGPQSGLDVDVTLKGASILNSPIPIQAHETERGFFFVVELSESAFFQLAMGFRYQHGTPSNDSDYPGTGLCMTWAVKYTDSNGNPLSADWVQSIEIPSRLLVKEGASGQVHWFEDAP